MSGIKSSLENAGSKVASLFEKKKSDSSEMANEAATDGAKVLEDTGEAVKTKAQDAKSGVDKFANDTAEKAGK